MARTHPKIISETETEQFLSEKVVIGRGVTVVTLMSSNTFAAKNLPFYDRKVILG